MIEMVDFRKKNTSLLKALTNWSLFAFWYPFVEFFKETQWQKLSPSSNQLVFHPIQDSTRDEHSRDRLRCLQDESQVKMFYFWSNKISEIYSWERRNVWKVDYKFISIHYTCMTMLQYVSRVFWGKKHLTVGKSLRPVQSNLVTFFVKVTLP